MIKNIAKKIKLLTQWFGLVGALLIIGMVVLIFIGRQTIGQLDDLRPSVQSFIASNTGFKVNLGPLSGEWPQLIPVINIQGVELIDSQQEPVLSLQGARADLDLFSSIRVGSPIWRDLAIDHLEINFFENDQGHWQLKGFSDESETDLNIILEPFLYSRHIRLKSITVNLYSFTGQKNQFFGSQMLIENDEDFHRMQLSVSVTEDDNPAYLVLEALGNLSDLDSFNAEGYLELKGLDLSESLKVLTQSLFHNVPPTLDKFSIKTDGEIWLDLHPGWQLDYKGKLSLSKVPLNWLADDIPPVTDIKTTMIGWYKPGRDWSARLQDLEFDIGKTSIDEPVNILYTQKLGSRGQEFDVSINHINLELVTDLIYEIDFLPTKTLETLKTINPRGNISSLSMGQSEEGLYVFANLDGCYIQPFKGVPGVKEIHGYIELKDKNGLFHIDDNDGFEILFPKSYRDYLAFKQAKGSIYFDWQSQNQLIVHSDSIHSQLEFGHSQLQFSIEQPIGDEKIAADFNLLIGAENLDMSLTKNYLPFTMPVRSSKWVKNAVKEGNLKQFGLLFRSGPPRNNSLSRTLKLLLDTENASVKFNPNWPQFNQLDGLFLLDGGNLSAQINSAYLGQAAVSQTRIEYSVKSPVEQRKWIIDGRLDADLPSMIDILVQSPLKGNLGPMVNWSFGGDTKTQLHIELPSYIPDNSKPPTTVYRVTSSIDNGKMTITDSPIILDKLSGEIEFTSSSGIFSDNLNALLWDKPFTAKLYRDDQQQMSFATALAPKSLNQFVDFPWQNIITDTITLNGLLAKDLDNPSKTVLDVKSDMKDVAINLPPPIGKDRDQSQQLELKLYFEPSLIQLKGKLGQRLISDIRFEQGSLKRGVISYDNPLTMPDQEGLLILAKFPTIDFKSWQPLSDLIAQTPKRADSPETLFDLELAQWKVSGLQLSEVNVRIKPVTQGLDATFTSDLADGSVTLYRDSNQPTKIALNRLELPNRLEDSSALDPRLLMATDFSVDKLSIAERDIGSLSFELRLEPSGALFNNISGNIFGLEPGVYSKDAPTDFFWGYDGKNHLSKLVGPIGINNIGDLFSSFDLPQVLDSQSGRLDADIAWRGEPWAINKDNLIGDFKISLLDGNFYRTPGGAGTALKLVGLFNFANWLRRLQLDFSDVIGQNLAYNRLDGSLSFDQSVLTLEEPLKIKMPSGRMSMAGDFDFHFETVDAQLVATLPVATNLPWLVGLTGGLPAALGVYATSKLVEKQVDRLSSISYEITGPWDDVEVSVDKIFADKLPQTK
ncbi:MAG: YhdP family protein [Porticoccaceae bacterium]